MVYSGISLCRGGCLDPSPIYDGEHPLFWDALIRAFYGLRLLLQKPLTAQIRENAAVITVQIQGKMTVLPS